MVKTDYKQFIGTVVKGSRKGSFQINVPREKTLLKEGDSVAVKFVDIKKIFEEN